MFFFENEEHIEILNAKGFCVDEVRHTGNPSHLSHNAVMDGVIRAFEEWRKIFTDLKGDSLKDYCAFFETISCGQGTHFSRLAHGSDRLRCFLNTVGKSCSRTPNDEILLKSMESVRKIYATDGEFARAGVNLVEKLRKNMQGRRFFISTLGTMGMAPAEAEAGDEICILLGCTCPVILRPHNDSDFYTLIGEAYVDGYMEGKGMDELEEGKYGLKEFEIH